MMAGNPNYWWNMHPPTTSLYHVLAANGSSSVVPALNSLPDHHHLQDPPQSWSQLLLSGNSCLSGDDEEERLRQNHFEAKKLENWEDQMIISSTASVNPPPRLPLHVVDHVKQEVLISQKISNLYGQAGDHGEMLMKANNNINRSANWSEVMPAVSSSPRSCITSLGTTSSILDFSYNNKADNNNNNNIGRNQTADHSATSECNSTATGGAATSKKARVQSSSSQPPLKVRKEKLGDRITALHQLVSPFGKTDTASVLLEAIGYIRFLQTQIEALSSPYLGHASKNMRNQPFEMEGQGKIKDLRSRGLCLVPVSCTQHVGSDNGADYWAPANYGSGF